MSDHSLTIEIPYIDQHLVELETAFITRDWSARSRVYARMEDLLEFSKDVARFSERLTGEVQFKVGAGSGSGYLYMRFYPTDLVGHVACHLELATMTRTNHRPEEEWKVTIELHTEPAALDVFLKELNQMVDSGSGRAKLTVE